MNNNKWTSCELGKVLTLQRGFDLPHRLRSAGTVPIVTSSGISDFHSEAKVAAPGIVTGRYGTIGEVFYVEEDFWPHNTTLYVRDFKGNNPLFLSYLLRTIDFQSHSGKSGVPGVNRNDLHKLPVLLPPLPEQEAIAEALADVDALLAALDKLIAKKRAIKQAAMQQLLTGKTRLPGFTGEWQSVSLGEFLSFKNGLNKSKEFFGYGTPIVNYMDVHSRPKIYGSSLEGSVDLNKHELRNFDVKTGDILFTRTSETQDEVGLSAVVIEAPADTVFSGFVLRGRPKDSRLDHQFAAYCLRAKYVRDQIVSKASYTTRALTNGRILSAVVIKVPPRPEQVAIATILSDMDAEITALEKRHDKTQQIKQGMMQQLLTGRIRLVNPSENES